jgi:hypothetical protein
MTFVGDPSARFGRKFLRNLSGGARLLSNAGRSSSQAERRVEKARSTGKRFELWVTVHRPTADESEAFTSRAVRQEERERRGACCIT